MPQFSDDLFLGTAVTEMGMNIGDPSPMSRGVGPLGRIYVWDTVPLAQNATNIAAAQTPGSAGALTLTPGTGTSQVVRIDGGIVIQLDVPRNVRISQADLGLPATFTIVGYDIYGQEMSEEILSVVNTVVVGTKAFYQILSVTVDGGTTTDCSVGTGNKLGAPVRVSNVGYVVHVGWDGALAADAGTFVPADLTSPATALTGDVRGTYLPSSAPDGSKRLVVSIALPALAVGPNATRLGALGVDQNLA